MPNLQVVNPGSEDQPEGEHDSARSSSRPWLPALLTLLGSSGVISVFGPITGELYWEGHLAAFGLTPEEFAALPARIRVFAYNAILEGFGSVVVMLLKYSSWILLLVPLATALVVYLQDPHVKARAERIGDRVRAALGHGARTSLPLRVVAATLLTLSTLFLTGYMLIAVFLITVSPTQARALGLAHGRAELSELNAREARAPAECDRIRNADFAGGCPSVVAYGEKFLAILYDGRIHRVPRESALFDSAVQAANAASSAASSPASPAVGAASAATRRRL